MTELQKGLTIKQIQPTNRRKICLEIILIVTITAAMFTAASQLSYKPQSSPTSQSSSSTKPWMVKGTYATYQGRVEPISYPVKITGEIQVTDLNASHVQVQTDMKISTTFAPVVSDSTFQWINKTNVIFQPKGEILVGTYDTQVSVAGIGTRSCTAYEYTNEAINATYYLDKSLQWPVKIVYETSFENQTYKIEVNISDTNILGLQTSS
jgi:hypothetical protein